MRTVYDRWGIQVHHVDGWQREDAPTEAGGLAARQGDLFTQVCGDR